MADQIFLGYPLVPTAVAEVMRATGNRLKSDFESILWERMENAGTIIMSRVFEVIENARFSVFDLTHLSENVLFEAGYALGRAKPMMLTLDVTISTAKQSWNDLAILKPIGYTPYMNSEDLTRRILSAARGLEPLYDELIEPAFPARADRTSLLYCPPYEPFEAANRLSALVTERQKQGLQVVTADPTESSFNPITWYAPKLASAAGVLINFAGASRNRSTIHNARNAFIAGLAVGLDVPVLMLAEDDYARPFDYEDILHVYQTAQRCIQLARDWLDNLEIDRVRTGGVPDASDRPLAGIRMGEHVAENERTELGEYFVRTSAYEDVVRARDTIFVGHRGTGKTANALQAFDELSANKDNLALLIKPSGFEFPGLVAAVKRVPEHTHPYLFDTLWKFIVQTELAAAILARIEDRPAYVPLDPGEQELISYVDSAPFDVRDDMSVRLDQALGHLATTRQEVTVESGRVLINEAFHAKALNQLRHYLGPVLTKKTRVAVFIDNLDKGWERQADLGLLARLIFGLLSARGRLVADFAKQDWWRDEIRLTIAIFLRSDIFSYVKREAREPDKLSISAISWRDPQVLASVLEQRFKATSLTEQNRTKLWGGVFPARISGLPAKTYVLNLVLPRPRDLVYFANAATAIANDRMHDSVLEEDILTAEEVYSRYAYEALLVENGITIPEIEAVLFSFLGANVVLTGGQVTTALDASGLPKDRHAAVLGRVLEMSFLGIETKPSHFEFPEVGSDMDRALARSAKLYGKFDDRRFAIHRAFHSFLDVVHGGEE